VVKYSIRPQQRRKFFLHCSGGRAEAPWATDQDRAITKQAPQQLQNPENFNSIQPILIKLKYDTYDIDLVNMNKMSTHV
jgi:hypothetical protein